MENEILINPSDKKILITLAEIKSYLQELDIADDAGELPDEESFRQFIFNRDIMIGRIRDFLKICLDRAGVAYRAENFSKLIDRNACLNLFFDAFEIAENENSAAPEKRDWLEVLPNGLPSAKIIFDSEKTAQDWRDAGLGEFPTDDAALKAALEKSPGKKVRAFLMKSLETYALEFDSDVVTRRLEKSECIELLGELFSILAQAEEKISEPEKISAETESAPPAVEFSFEDIDEIYQNGLGVNAEDKIACKNLTFVKNMPLTIQKNKTIRLDGIEIYRGQVALVNLETQKTAALGHLEGNDAEPALVFPANKIAFDRIINDSELYDLIIFPADFKRLANNQIKFYKVPCEASCREPENALRPLCIDFGTSNTTAGSYGVQTDGIDLVEFPDGAGKKFMIPTLVYVESCKDAQNIKYLFGYEAAARIEALHYEPRATVFHEIKSWIDDLDRVELIYDEHKYHTKIARKNIIKAYLDNVIQLAEEYFEVHFKELHFSAPVKLKGVFIDKMTELFKNERRVIDSRDSLDEGVAIVYDYIVGRIEKKPDGGDVLEEGREENVLILDCGGGTTDLAQCRYSYTASDLDNSRRLTIYTEFENGDSAFGGNNITYRILQLLKIKIAGSLSEKNSEQDILQEVMNFSEYEIMTKIDKSFSAKNEIYQKFEANYRAAEKYISTRFSEPNLYPDEARMRRRNYYYLWQMAEAIKLEFYKSTNTVAIDFDNDRDREICVSGAENYYLYVCRKEGGKTERYENPLKNIRVTIKEINRIICPDIYALLCTILNEYDDASENNLLKANFYKLSGQSCNISLFHDLLKEFIPGRKIRREKTSGTNAQDDRLKISCVKGSIRYLMDKNVGKITPNIIPAPPVPVYQIFEANNENGVVKDLFSKDALTLDRKPANTRHIKIAVKDSNGRIRNDVTYEFETGFDRKREINLSDLALKVGRKAEFSGGVKEKFETAILGKLQKINLIIDTDRKSQFCLFVMPAKNGYGFLVYLLVVLMEGAAHKFYLQEDGKFYSYERLESFFDGKR